MTCLLESPSYVTVACSLSITYLLLCKLFLYHALSINYPDLSMPSVSCHDSEWYKLSFALFNHSMKLIMLFIFLTFLPTTIPLIFPVLLLQYPHDIKVWNWCPYICSSLLSSIWYLWLIKLFVLFCFLFRGISHLGTALLLAFQENFYFHLKYELR